jgi:hypothetical protein
VRQKKQKKWEGYEEFVRTHGDALVRLSYVLCGDRGKAAGRGGDRALVVRPTKG